MCFDCGALQEGLSGHLQIWSVFKVVPWCISQVISVCKHPNSREDLTGGWGLLTLSKGPLFCFFRVTKDAMMIPIQYASSATELCDAKLENIAF
jgi:hypothetical protein